MEGVIEKLTDRGFGFIKHDDFERGIFFHATSLVDGLNYEDLQEGDKVSFELIDNPNGKDGKNAVDVSKID
jgi:cold shock CspA family protein